MPDQVPEPVKKERSAVLLKLEKKMSGEYRSSFAGTEQEILLEEPVTINDEDLHDRVYKGICKGSDPSRRT